MANSRTSGETYEEASVDTDPGANGYACLSVSNKVSAKFLNFYIKSIGTGAEVVLQWKRTDDTSWYDIGNAYTATGKYALQDKATDVYYRAIVKDDKQGSGGTTVFGIEW